MKINKTSLESAAIEYLTEVDRLQCHVQLRIDASGEAYVDTDAGYSISAAEFNREEGAAKTVKHAQGNGQCNLPDDWHQDAPDAIQDFIDSVYEDLRHEGIEIEEVD